MPNSDTHKIHVCWALVMKLLLSSLKLCKKKKKKKNCIVLLSWLCCLTFDVLEIRFIAPTETLYLSCIRVLQLPKLLNSALLCDFSLMGLKLVTRQMLLECYGAESRFTTLGTAFVQRPDPCTFIWSIWCLKAAGWVQVHWWPCGWGNCDCSGSGWSPEWRLCSWHNTWHSI